MDVRAYYQKIRAIEQELPEGDVVVVSLETPDGGRAGRVMEAGRRLAAKMIADQRARIADAHEIAAFREQHTAEQAEFSIRNPEFRSQFTVERDRAVGPPVKGKK